MKLKAMDPQNFLSLVSVMILLVGLGGSVLIYQTADSDGDDVFGYELSDGSVYSIMSDDSRQYRHDLELYGGKANVIADEFRQWFLGCWSGKSLAFTVAAITILMSVGVFYAADCLPSRSGGG